MCAGQNSTFGVLAPQTLEQCISTEDVLAAVETLYDDELKPYGRILRKRLVEKGAEKGCFDADMDIQSIRELCEACPLLRVQVEEAGEWSVTLTGQRSCFVDVYSPEDYYPSELWQQMADYFNSFQDSVIVLPGGRYDCAQALMAHRFPFLDGCSLGQVSHIVQLAISQKKILGYSNGTVVPYKYSQSMVKDQCAENQRPCLNSTRRSKRLATWESVRSGMQQILEPCVAVSDVIALSNWKRLFRSRFRQELSETALGHSKLSELLQDERLSDLCTVQLQGNGYVVVPRLHKNDDSLSTTEHEGEATGDLALTGTGEQRAMEGNLSYDSLVGQNLNSQLQEHGKEDYKYIVQNTFITVLPVCSTQSLSHKRVRSLPRDMGSRTKEAWESNCQVLCFLTPPLSGGLTRTVGSSDSTASPISATTEMDRRALAITNLIDNGSNCSDTLSSHGMLPESNMDCKEDCEPTPGLEGAAKDLPESEVSMHASLENSCATEATGSLLPTSGTTCGVPSIRGEFQSVAPAAELCLASMSPIPRSKTAVVSGQCGNQTRRTRAQRRRQRQGQFSNATCTTEHVSWQNACPA